MIPLADIGRVEALIALREGRWDDARRSLDEAVTRCCATPYPYGEAKARYVYGLYYLAKDMPEQGQQQLAQALTICERLGEKPYCQLIGDALRSASNDEGRTTTA